METYNWSDNIIQAVIKITRDFPVKFNEQEIAPGETKVFTQEGHGQKNGSFQGVYSENLMLSTIQACICTCIV